jgi:hypothetical protein
MYDFLVCTRWGVLNEEPIGTRFALRGIACEACARLKRSLAEVEGFAQGDEQKEFWVMKKSSGFIGGLRRFIRVEDGLVTVEWVALTAGMVVAAVAIGFIVMSNTYKQASSVATGISTTTTAKYGANGSKLGS